MPVFPIFAALVIADILIEPNHTYSIAIQNPDSSFEASTQR
ncbi:MAG TPA: hypothetical protein VHB01_05355 [Nitrosospira sp.]|nr:hypothetical protein [Nitrosospira sp.]